MNVGDYGIVIMGANGKPVVVPAMPVTETGQHAVSAATSDGKPVAVRVCAAQMGRYAMHAPTARATAAVVSTDCEPVDPDPTPCCDDEGLAVSACFLEHGLMTRFADGWDIPHVWDWQPCQAPGVPWGSVGIATIEFATVDPPRIRIAVTNGGNTEFAFDANVCWEPGAGYNDWAHRFDWWYFDGPTDTAYRASQLHAYIVPVRDDGIVGRWEPSTTDLRLYQLGAMGIGGIFEVWRKTEYVAGGYAVDSSGCPTAMSNPAAIGAERLRFRSDEFEWSDMPPYENTDSVCPSVTGDGRTCTLTIIDRFENEWRDATESDCSIATCYDQWNA
jgi:hypothetical protein